jgi:hypothetical protein
VTHKLILFQCALGLFARAAFSPTTEAYVAQGIIAGDHPLSHQPITVLSGEGALVRGTVLGKVEVGAATVAAKAGGNTGNGTFVIDATTPTLVNATPGIYALRCIEAVANGGKFTLLGPTGLSLGQYIIPAGAGASITIADRIKGVLTDGATDFVVGRRLRHHRARRLGQDAQEPGGRHRRQPDAALHPHRRRGRHLGRRRRHRLLRRPVRGRNLTYGTGHTATTVEAAFRAAGVPIYLKNVGTAA